MTGEECERRNGKSQHTPQSHGSNYTAGPVARQRDGLWAREYRNSLNY